MTTQAERQARILQMQARARQQTTQGAAVPGQDRRAGQGQGNSATLSEAWKALDDTVRSYASGLTFNMADEAAAGLSSLTGVGAQPGGRGDYASNLEAERARDEAIPPVIAIPGQVAGALTTGLGAGRAGLTLLNAAKPTAGSMALRGGAEGAAYGAAHGAGSAEGGAQERAEGALWGAFLGGLTGGGVGAVGGKMAEKAAEKTVATTQQIKASGNRAYDRAFGSGVVLSQGKFGQITDDLYKTAKSRGASAKLAPKVYGALDEFEALRGGTPTLQELDTLRKTLKISAGSVEKSERALAQKLIEQLDDTLERLTPGDVIAGNVAEGTAALKEARALWTRGGKAETIEKLIRRAEKRAGQYSGGMENSLRTEFRNLSMNEKKMRLFTPEEQRAIELVGEGAPLTNVMRWIGKAAPTGIVSSGVGIGTTAAFGPWGMALPAAGLVGRGAATGLTKGAANKAALTMRAGPAGIPQAGPLSPAMVNTLRAFLLAPVPAETRAVNAFKPPSRAR